MKEELRVQVRKSMLRLGRRATPRQLDQLRSVLSYLELGRWLADAAIRQPADVAGTFELFEVALKLVVGAKPLYLEFGVAEGRSMRWWACHLTAPGASLVGFDSFEGLPENWRGLRAGHFRTGAPPQIDDERVTFQVGWFDQTLPEFTWPEHDQLIVNVDCDLYSSAVTVLGAVEPHLRPGSLIYFDEFCDRDGEMRAFMELLARSKQSFEPVATADGGIRWLFRVR